MALDDLWKRTYEERVKDSKIKESFEKQAEQTVLAMRNLGHQTLETGLGVIINAFRILTGRVGIGTGLLDTGGKLTKLVARTLQTGGHSLAYIARTRAAF